MPIIELTPEQMDEAGITYYASPESYRSSVKADLIALQRIRAKHIKRWQCNQAREEKARKARFERELRAQLEAERKQRDERKRLAVIRKPQHGGFMALRRIAEEIAILRNLRAISMGMACARKELPA